ncbi:hypothetical protein [Mycobacteroides abscessus]|uniref:hypothetical protein n=1 Tax=Mycobacteroides abscessus TaxID=36809 RepID=UPI002104B959|nr:hypothetical protein [Mycobacteroides abscessus]
MSAGSRIHRQARDAVYAACEAGWGIPGKPGDLTWIEFNDRSEPVDWRDMADIIPAALEEKLKKFVKELVADMRRGATA